MKNYIQPGKTLALTAPYDVLSGAGFLVGGIFAVAAHDALQNEPVEGSRLGVFDLAKVSAQAWTQGDPIFWDNTNKLCTNVAGDHLRVGNAVEGAANPSSTGKVDLRGVAVLGGASAPSAAIPNLQENGGAIGGTNDGDLPALDAPTGSSGGTPNGALEDVSTVVTGVDGTGSNAASKADVDARLAAIANNFAEAFAEIAAAVAAVREVATDNNAIKAALRAKNIIAD
jgi:predicted RecA/RadA family phage recombinase